MRQPRPVPPSAMRPLQALRLLGAAWAAPCSAIGLLLALPVLLLGGRARRVDHTLEVSLDAQGGLLARLVDAWPFAAITFGQVILGSHAAVLAALRAHERVHVQQYHAWGPLFLLAYPASSLWQLLRGRHPYWHNHFERQAHGLPSGGRPRGWPGSSPGRSPHQSQRRT